MTIEPHSTKFDCVAFMREARDRISDKMTTMSHEEFRHWLRSFRYTDPALQHLADRLRTADHEDGEAAPAPIDRQRARGRDAG